MRIINHVDCNLNFEQYNIKFKYICCCCGIIVNEKRDMS